METFYQRQQRVRAPQRQPEWGPRAQAPQPQQAADTTTPPKAPQPLQAPQRRPEWGPRQPQHAEYTPQTAAGQPSQSGQTAAAAPGPQPGPQPGPGGNNTTPVEPNYYTAQQFAEWQRTRYGRVGTAAEMARIGGRVGAAAGPDGQYTQAQWEAGQRESDAIAAEYGWNGAGQQQPNPNNPGPYGPNSGVDPNVPGNVGHQGRVPITPGSAYQAGQLNPYTRANTGAVEGQAQTLMERLLANPESLPPDVVAQMKAAGKSDAATQAAQLRNQASTALAGRGFSSTGGMEAAAGAAVDQGFLASLLDSNRNVDITAATTNFNNRLQASSAGNDYLNAATTRNVANAGAENERFGVNESARQGESADALARGQFSYSQMQGDRSANLQEWLARQGVNLDNQKFVEMQDQFKRTFGLDVMQFLESIRQYDQNFGEGRRQFNVGAGLNTAALRQRSEELLLNWYRSAAGV